MKSAAILVFAMLFPSAAAYVYFVRLSGAGQGDSNSYVQVIYAATKIFMLLLPLIYIGWCDRRWRPFPKSSSSGVVWGIAFGLAVAFAIVVLAQNWSETLLKDVPQQVRDKITQFGVSTPMTYLAMSVFLSTVHAFIEEYYWRWFVFGRLRMLGMRFVWAATLSGIAFAGHHVFVLNEYLPGQFWNATLPFSIGIALGGFFWAWLYEYSGSLIGPWISHLLVDVAIMAVGYRMYFLNH